jgi:preprotein translocase subunit SecE
VARTGYENIYILNVQVVTYVWVTKKKQQRRYSNGNFYASFKEELLKILKVKGESLLSSTPVVVLSTILGRTQLWKNIKLQ